MTDRLRASNHREDLGDGLIRVARSPAKSARKVIAGAQRNDANRRNRIETSLVKLLENPADRTIAAAGQHAKVGHMLEHFECRAWTGVVQINHLARPDETLELAHQRVTLLPTRLGVHKYQQRRDFLIDEGRGSFRVRRERSRRNVHASRGAARGGHRGRRKRRRRRRRRDGGGTRFRSDFSRRCRRCNRGTRPIRSRRVMKRVDATKDQFIMDRTTRCGSARRGGQQAVRVHHLSTARTAVVTKADRMDCILTFKAFAARRKIAFDPVMHLKWITRWWNKPVFGIIDLLCASLKEPSGGLIGKLFRRGTGSRATRCVIHREIHLLGRLWRCAFATRRRGGTTSRGESAPLAPCVRGSFGAGFRLQRIDSVFVTACCTLPPPLVRAIFKVGNDLPAGIEWFHSEHSTHRGRLTGCNLAHRR
mmetsp:Transcript_11704/g.29578  ORF Transcript_11704/g.29578 Transcript_11704/m.29578 type:complete len:421 (+) Transcript_11704:780-2042(+)